MAYLPAPFTPTWNPMYSQQQQQPQGLIWVDGEAAAKSYQMPAGWPANTPLALWDTNDTIIYLKSINNMGMPNPLQIAEYQLRELIPKRSGAPAGRDDYTEQTWDQETINKLTAEVKAMREEINKLKEEKE